MEKKSFMKKLTGSREALLAVILVLLFVVITIISPSFLTFKSLTDMLKNNAVTMVMSLGMLCVMLNIINLRLDITHLYYPAKNSFQKGRLKRREIFTELLLYTLTT